MSRRFYFFFLCFFLVLILSSCEDVIDVDIPEEEIRLVINGIARVDSTKEFFTIEVRATETSTFDKENKIAQLENVNILFGTLNERAPELTTFSLLNLSETEPGSGVYLSGFRTETLGPLSVFYLFADYKDREYAAMTMYQSSTPIDDISQGTETLFDENDTELIIRITDPEEPNQFYVLDFGKGEYTTLSDEFFNGQEFEFSYFLERDVVPNEQIKVSLLGADQEFFNYMNKLLEQTEEGFNLFQPPATTIRGNVFDITGLDNIFIVDNVERPTEFALGYFAIVEEYRDSLIIE